MLGESEAHRQFAAPHRADVMVRQIDRSGRRSPSAPAGDFMGARAAAAIPRALVLQVLCRMFRGTIAVRAFLGTAGWWLATLLQMQACTSRRIAPATKRVSIFT